MILRSVAVALYSVLAFSEVQYCPPRPVCHSHTPPQQQRTMSHLVITIALAIIMTVVAPAAAYPYGPPSGDDEVCRSMFPTGHNVSAKSERTPYWTTAEKTTYKAGETISVTFWSALGDYYEGIFMQAREAGANGKVSKKSPVGTFSIPSGTAYPMKTMKCLGMENSAAAHSTKQKKKNITLTWTAPSSNAPVQIVFEATYVRETDEFWTEVLSEVVKREGPASGSRGVLPFLALSILAPLLCYLWRE